MAARASGRWSMVADAGLTELRQSDGPPAAAVAGDSRSIVRWELRGSSVRGLIWGSGLREQGREAGSSPTPPPPPTPVAPSACGARLAATSNMARHGMAQLQLLLHAWLRLSASPDVTQNPLPFRCLCSSP
ncbi:hypothetical protein NDU88_001763 [Pleurodeles waltl]|uniref:Uncharacterized protein n=1 Tax=Pleurodeles waltl TaxID=8319 RepID=A0AAV7P7M4_PLEWA|nr:hypothetical protein NDU88_001763 [Pleurodeles waltl]